MTGAANSRPGLGGDTARSDNWTLCRNRWFLKQCQPNQTGKQNNDADYRRHGKTTLYPIHRKALTPSGEIVFPPGLPVWSLPDKSVNSRSRSAKVEILLATSDGLTGSSQLHSRDVSGVGKARESSVTTIGIFNYLARNDPTSIMFSLPAGRSKHARSRATSILAMVRRSKVSANHSDPSLTPHRTLANLKVGRFQPLIQVGSRIDLTNFPQQFFAFLSRP